MKYYYTFTHSIGATVYTSESGKKLVVYNGEYYRTIGEVKIEHLGAVLDDTKEIVSLSNDSSLERIEYLKSKGEL